jgi:cellulose synthase/poly-beta-1,6-N-acetylglucosamine synthase-like glycosyltransferase
MLANGLLIIIAGLYLLVVSLLFIYGLNFFYLSYISMKHRNISSMKKDINTSEALPLVTIQLPIYNELYVAERLIKAATEINYPSDKLEIQVLDDSTDKTVKLVSRQVHYYQEQGINIVHLHRVHRDGFKAGALAEGLEKAHGEYVAIFDADFLPKPDFLEKTIDSFQDENVAFVQTRWGHTNRDFSLLTLLQSLSIDAHFMVEQFGRNHKGFWFNFNGTAGIWRRSAIDDAGGWSGDTLTEDLDLSYRAFLKGWRAVYMRDVVAPAEIPVSFSALRRQRHRWARGSLECAIKLLPKVWNSTFPLITKIEGTLHLTGYFVHILLFLLSILYPIVILVTAQIPELIALYGIGLIFNITAVAPFSFFLVAQLILGRRWYQSLPVLLFISIFGIGMMLNTVRAAFQILKRKPEAFERTPKFGVIEKGQQWIRKQYQIKLDSIVYFEILFALFNIGTVILGLYHANWIISIYAAMFAFGLIFTSIYTIGQAFKLRQQKYSSHNQPTIVTMNIGSDSKQISSNKKSI